MNKKLPLKIAQIIRRIDEHANQLQRLKEELREIKNELDQFHLNSEFTDHLANFIREMETTLEIITEMIKLARSIAQNQEIF